MHILNEHTIRFNEVFDQYFSPLCYFAEKIIKSREDAKDIVVESFQKYWLRKEDFGAPAQVKSFLYLVTRNACFDFLKKMKMINSKSTDFPELFNSDMEETAARLEVEAELLRKIYKVATQLPPKCKDIFQLTYFEGLNTAQVAERLNTTTTNVTSQKSRALKILRIALAADEKSIPLLILLAMDF